MGPTSRNLDMGDYFPRGTFSSVEKLGQIEIHDAQPILGVSSLGDNKLLIQTERENSLQDYMIFYDGKKMEVPELSGIVAVGTPSGDILAVKDNQLFFYGVSAVGVELKRSFPLDDSAATITTKDILAEHPLTKEVQTIAKLLVADPASIDISQRLREATERLDSLHDDITQELENPEIRISASSSGREVLVSVGLAVFNLQLDEDLKIIKQDTRFLDRQPKAIKLTDIGPLAVTVEGLDVTVYNMSDSKVAGKVSVASNISSMKDRVEKIIEETPDMSDDLRESKRRYPDTLLGDDYISEIGISMDGKTLVVVPECPTRDFYDYFAETRIVVFDMNRDTDRGIIIDRCEMVIDDEEFGFISVNPGGDRLIVGTSKSYETQETERFVRLFDDGVEVLPIKTNKPANSEMASYLDNGDLVLHAAFKPERHEFYRLKQ